MSETIVAPWTPEQVAALERYQQSNYVHPYTCGKRGDSPHEYRYGDLGALVPTENGWVCPDCDYTQTWAHSSSVTIMDSVNDLWNIIDPFGFI